MEFKWLNESKISQSGNRLGILATPESDFFIDCLTGESKCNAPYYYTELAGDFVLKVKVSHDFKEVFDACVVMVMKDLSCYGKFCFEHTDFNTHAVVSVVTNGVSDDANGSNVDGNCVWLQVCRVGKAFAFHYSVDGENYYMTRYFHLPVGDTVKVGLSAQSPLGQGGVRVFENLSIENKTVKNIRVGK